VRNRYSAHELNPRIIEKAGLISSGAYSKLQPIRNFSTQRKIQIQRDSIVRRN
jgi:hypothetical protein